MQKINEEIAAQIGKAIYEIDWTQKDALATVEMMYVEVLMAVFDNQFKCQKSVWNLSRSFASALKTLNEWYGVKHD